METTLCGADGCSANVKVKEAWQKVTKNLNVPSRKKFRKMISREERKSTKNIWTSDVDFNEKDVAEEAEKELNKFKFVNGLPIKDSDKESFSSGFFTNLAINPEGNALVIWIGIITIGFTYFAWTIIARQSFELLQDAFRWSIFDFSWDLMFIADIFIHAITGFLEDGLLVTKTSRVTKRYVLSRWFFLDLACLLPFPFVSPNIPLLRLPRLLKVFRAKEFIKKIEWAIAFPNVLRVANLVHTLMLLMHWFACFYFMVSVWERDIPEQERGWAYPFTQNETEWSALRRQYLHSLYWSCLTLTTIGEKQSPTTDIEYLCTMAAYFLGIFVFATVVGQVGNVIASQNENKQAYQKMMDHAKRFMTAKNIPKSMQQRVLRWYRFSRTRGTLTGDNDVNSLQMVPDSLKTELAILVNLNTLRKVSIFHLVQPEFLHHLVLKMKSCIYTPNDYVCKYGEVGKEMFIVNHGLLEVLSETETVVARLKTGDFFGEIGILNLNDGVNKRVASVRSVGYSEVFILSADDLIQAMDYYPEAKQLLLLYGRRRFQETEKRKFSKRSSVSSQQSNATHRRDTLLYQNQRHKTAEILVSSAASTIESAFLEGFFPQHAEEHHIEAIPEESDGDEKSRVFDENNSQTSEELDKLESIVKLLKVIIDEQRTKKPSTTLVIQQQKKLIEKQKQEIDRLNVDIKLLMEKLDEHRS